MKISNKRPKPRTLDLPWIDTGYLCREHPAEEAGVPNGMNPDSESRIFSGIAILSGSAPRAVVAPMSVSAYLLGKRAGRVYRQRCIQRTKHSLLAHDPFNRNKVVERQSGKIALDSVVEEELAESLLDQR